MFLNGELAETVFVKQAPGFVVKGTEHMVLKLRKALQSTRHLRRAWVHSLRYRARALHAAMGEGGAHRRRVRG